VQSIINGEQTQTVYKDTRKLAAQAVQMGEALLDGQECEANDTETYDNGVKVVPTYMLEPVSIDADNWRTIVEDGYIKESDLNL
jgi:putative multiple sugar transport system substrate-binding protein